VPTKRFLLICIDGAPLPLLKQVELDDNCNDEAFFRKFRSAYEEARIGSEPPFHPDAPRWFKSCVRCTRRLNYGVQRGFARLFEVLHVTWLVHSVGISVFSVPTTANFVRVSTVRAVLFIKYHIMLGNERAAEDCLGSPMADVSTAVI
jgi:hypothetical protein